MALKRTASSAPLLVMPGLDPGIHEGARPRLAGRDGRVKPGHDDGGLVPVVRMPGLDPGISSGWARPCVPLDGRVEPGHDGRGVVPLVRISGAGA